jgi:hypothetical protein
MYPLTYVRMDADSIKMYKARTDEDKKNKSIITEVFIYFSLGN